MLALITGAGALPDYLRRQSGVEGRDFLWASLLGEEDAGFQVSLGTLGGLIGSLKAAGCDRVCLAGSIDRRRLNVGEFDEATMPLLPRLKQALALGDNAALGIILSIFEENGLQVVAAHQVCPQLLPTEGVLTRAAPDAQARADAERAAQVLSLLGPADIGQACVIESGLILAVEALPGTDHMLDALAGFRQGRGRGGIVMKAPKPGQDWRADLPLVGPDTVAALDRANLAGLVIEAGGVMALDLSGMAAALDQAGRFLWVRPR